jgi:L-arabinokinase
VSSSAALEVAAMAATATCFDVRLNGAELATAAQWAENHIAGAPCGIMDQMTSALGRRDRLLRLECQPATVDGHVAVPPGYRFYGIDSGIRHAVTGSDYGTVRTAAFMGYRMIAELAGLRASRVGSIVQVDDDRWHGYLANITPAELDARFADHLPDRMLGAEFIERFGGITDPVTPVVRERWYPVRAATEQLRGLPDAVIIADDGILQDGGEAYAAKLGQAGVRVTAVRYNQTIHDFAMLNPLADTPAVRGR